MDVPYPTLTITIDYQGAIINGIRLSPMDVLALYMWLQEHEVEIHQIVRHGEQKNQQLCHGWLVPPNTKVQIA